jgi:CBS domain-containing protein
MTVDIQELMSKPAVTCRATDRLNIAAQLMWEHDCGSIPVTDTAGTLVGIVTDRDICMAAYTKGAPLSAIKVSEAMAKQVFTCHASDSVEAAEQLMSEKQIRRVPVVDGASRPVGLISLNDIARYVAAARKKNGLDSEVTQTLAAICQPRSQRARPWGRVESETQQVSPL